MQKLNPKSFVLLNGKQMKPRSIFFPLILFSLICAVRLELATVFQPACVNEFLELPCPVQDSSSDSIWKYKTNLYAHWQKIGSFSKNNISLLPNISAKFKDMTNVTSNGSLTISKFAQEMTGIYYCPSVNEGHVLHKMFKVVAVSCQMTVCEGDDAFVECDILKHRNLLYLNPRGDIVWKQKRTTLVVIGPNMNVQKNRKYPNVEARQGDGALRIGSASKDIDGQRYTCVVHGKRGVTSRQHSVVVNVQKCQTKIIEACEGESVDLKCPYYLPLTKNTKNIRLEWYNESSKIATVPKDQGHAIRPDSSLVKINETNGIVTLVSPGIFDNGRYRCKVFRDTVLLAEHSVTLNVTQCPSPTGHRKPTKQGTQGSKEKEAKTKAQAEEKAEKIRDICILVFFAVIVVVVLPIFLYHMVKRRRPNPDQPLVL